MSTVSPTSSNSSADLSSLTIFGRLQSCWRTKAGTLSITVLVVSHNLFLLPLCLSVLNLGRNRWHQQGKGTPLSHSDVFTFHIVILELMNVLGSTLSCLGIHTNIAMMQAVGIYLFANVFSGQMMFHILTCVEQYLAVVHPVAYLALKTAKGIRLRNITIGCVWLACLVGMGYLSLPDQRILAFLSFSMVPLALVCISFCSISVLCVLVRPGPGRRSGNKQKVDRSKLRAFYTITAILSTLLIRFGGHICGNTLYEHLSKDNNCAVWMAESWFCLPSSLVLPLLFLHSARKRPHSRDKR